MAIELSKRSRRTIIASQHIQESDYGVFVSHLGEDPATYFEGKDWRGVDFRETDVRCLSFARADLRQAVVDEFQLRHLENCPEVSTEGLIVRETIIPRRSSGQMYDAIFASDLSSRHEFQEELWVDVPEDSGAPRSVIEWAQANMQIKNALEEGETPDEATIDRFIQLTEGTDDVMLVLRVLRHIDYSPSVRQLNMLLTRCSNFTESKKFLEIFPEYQAKPNIDTFTRLVSQARTYSDAFSVIANMDEQGVRRGRQFFNRLLVRTPSLAAANEVFGIMRGEGVNPSVATYNTLISKCASFNEATECLAQMNEEGFRANCKTFNRLVAKLHNFAEAVAVVEKMNDHGVLPDEETIRLLVRRAQSGSQAIKIIRMAKEAYLEVTKGTFETAINLAIGKPLDELLGLAREDGWDVVDVLGHRVDSSEDIRGGGLQLVSRNPLGV